MGRKVNTINWESHRPLDPYLQAALAGFCGAAALFFHLLHTASQLQQGALQLLRPGKQHLVAKGAEALGEGREILMCKASNVTDKMRQPGRHRAHARETKGANKKGGCIRS